MIEELLLWLWLFLRVSGFVQQKNPADSLKRHALCYRKTRATSNCR
jgi:hypothetical protein